MDRSSVTFQMACLLIVTLLCLAPSCDGGNWLFGLPVSFVAGAVVGYLLPHPPTVVRECYQNGVQVDCEDLSVRVARGGYPPRGPTDPYVRALAHTVPQITVSPRVGTRSGRRSPPAGDTCPADD